MPVWSAAAPHTAGSHAVNALSHVHHVSRGHPDRFPSRSHGEGRTARTRTTSAMSSTSALMLSLPIDTNGSLVETVDTTTPMRCALGSILYSFQLCDPIAFGPARRHSFLRQNERAASGRIVLDLCGFVGDHVALRVQEQRASVTVPKHIQALGMDHPNHTRPHNVSAIMCSSEGRVRLLPTSFRRGPPRQTAASTMNGWPAWTYALRPSPVAPSLPAL